MDVNDQRRNYYIRSELNQILSDYAENENVLVLGDFNGHLGFIGEQELNENGRYVLEIMEGYNLVLLNGDLNCDGRMG